MTDHQKENLISGLWWLFFCVTSTLWCVTAARSLSATFDEPLYFQIGLDHWRNGLIQPLMRWGAMPLSIDVQALPLYLMEKWRGVAIDPIRDFAWGLPILRAGTLWFWWLLLIYGFKIGRSLGGTWGGRLAVALLAWEPNLLAHATLATADIAVTACLMILYYEFEKSRSEPWGKRVLRPGLLYGIAMLAKASALVYGPLVVIVIEGARLWRRGELGQRAAWLRFGKDFRSILLLGFATVLLYCGSDWKTEPSFVKWAQSLHPGMLHDSMLWLSQYLAIFSNGAEGLVQQIKHNIRGHDAYLLGHEYRRAVWYYFPVALSIKCTLALLAVAVMIALSRCRALLNWACLSAVALLVYSLNCRVQIGVRLVLPLIALACIGFGAALVWTRHKRTLCLLAMLAVAWNGYSAVRVWPEALCYTNELYGGTPNGFLLVSDSNYDWGQGLYELRAWAGKHQVETVDVWYFGKDPAVRIPPLRELPLHQSEPGRSTADAVRGKCVAVSTTLLYGGYAKETPGGAEALDFFKMQKPADRTTTFFIYDFRH